MSIHLEIRLLMKGREYQIIIIIKRKYTEELQVLTGLVHKSD